MKRVDQTTFGHGTGNCFQACVASIFDLPLSAVPNFCVDYDEKEWWVQLDLWCAARGVAPAEFVYDKGEYSTDLERLRWPCVRRGVSFIVSGKNKHDVDHCIVVTWGQHGAEVHDPNPNREGLVSYRDVIVFVALALRTVRHGNSRAEGLLVKPVPFWDGVDRGQREGVDHVEDRVYRDMGWR